MQIDLKSKRNPNRTERPGGLKGMLLQQPSRVNRNRNAKRIEMFTGLGLSVLQIDGRVIPWECIAPLNKRALNPNHRRVLNAKCANQWVNP